MQYLGLEVKVLVIQSCPTLRDPTDCSLPGYSVCGFLQARMLECIAISFSGRSSQLRDQTQVSCIVGGFFTAELPGKPNLGMLVVKNPPANAGDWDSGSIWDDPLEGKMAIHSSIFAWRIPWTEKPGGSQTIRSQIVGHNWNDLAHSKVFITCLHQHNVNSMRTSEFIFYCCVRNYYT